MESTLCYQQCSVGLCYIVPPSSRVSCMYVWVCSLASPSSHQSKQYVLCPNPSIQSCQISNSIHLSNPIAPSSLPCYAVDGKSFHPPRINTHSMTWYITPNKPPKLIIPHHTRRHSLFLLPLRNPEHHHPPRQTQRPHGHLPHLLESSLPRRGSREELHEGENIRLLRPRDGIPLINEAQEDALL